MNESGAGTAFIRTTVRRLIDARAADGKSDMKGPCLADQSGLGLGVE